MKNTEPAFSKPDLTLSYSEETFTTVEIKPRYWSGHSNTGMQTCKL